MANYTTGGLEVRIPGGLQIRAPTPNSFWRWPRWQQPDATNTAITTNSRWSADL
ncbi:MAG: hypothetical protein SF097_23140 [Acidobacteriota bacterium]|nr:hypothetical protein [Acidobacteriota bacterium]